MKIENHAVHSQKIEGGEVEKKPKTGESVSSKQLRLTVATDRRKKKNKTGSFLKKYRS